MKQRVITGAAAAALFLIVLFVPWTAALTIANAAICAIAVYEMLRVTKVLFCAISKYITHINFMLQAQSSIIFF